MNATEEDLSEIANTIWESLFTVPLERVSSEGVIAGGAITGCVTIEGAWHGAVMLIVGGSLATALAAELFDSDDPVTQDDVRDTVGELTNMLAGNFKALVAHPSHLSLPTVAVGSHYSMSVVGAQEILAVRFGRVEGLLQISVHQGKGGGQG